jgi:hypothetical protein
MYETQMRFLNLWWRSRHESLRATQRFLKSANRSQARLGSSSAIRTHFTRCQRVQSLTIQGSWNHDLPTHWPAASELRLLSYPQELPDRDVPQQVTTRDRSQHLLPNDPEITRRNVPFRPHKLRTPDSADSRCPQLITTPTFRYSPCHTQENR